MNRRTDKIKLAFELLLARAKAGEAFSVAELAEASGWTRNNTETNLQKRLRDLVREDGEGYRARPEALRVRFDDFVDLFRQKQRLFTDYVLRKTANVLVYEFFMPLSREDRLREALDNLFYRDTVEQRVREIGYERVRERLGLPLGCSDDEVSRIVCSLVGDAIGGYSLYLVNGRFRVEPLESRNEVAGRRFADGPYLMDETTAVVRFILPLASEEDLPVQGDLFEPVRLPTDTTERAEQMRWLFLQFFAEAVTRVVRKEDEIWLLETGMKTALYRWVRRDE